MTKEDEVEAHIEGNPERIAIALMNAMMENETCAAIVCAAVEGFNADTE